VSPTLLQERAAELKAAHEVLAEVKADNGRAPTDAETAKINEHIEKVKGIDARILAAKAGQSAIDALGQLGDAPGDQRENTGAARSLGEHFVKSVGAESLAELKNRSQVTVASTEFKANTDTALTTGSVYGPILTEYDRTIVRAVRPRLVVEDLLSSGTISGNAITYLVEAAMEGAFTTVAEAGAKPQIHFVDPTTRTDALKKVAGFLKFSDEMLEDLDFIVTEINNRGVYELQKFVEAQLLSGAGTGTTILGLLNRSGIQTETAADADDNADALFRSMTKVQTGSGLDADGIVMNPTDYQKLRLSRDANGQYFGGGFFTGQYGVGGILQQPPVWGLRTVVSPSISAGTALVGAFQQAATAYSKGGIRVESTNSHSTDFTSNLITTRIETRKALAVRVPLGFVAVTLV
jgi:HK97 family phage major capsid protein